tara:strand:- start:634 stop:822 length:189 start_codon:yes stop_codon:yes gene_type:complete
VGLINNRERKIMTENEVVEYVQTNARYHSQIDMPYAVYFNGRPLFGNDPRDLVEQILDIVNG